MEPRASSQALRQLPTPVRPVVDATDVSVPDGYFVEPVVVGLSFPTAMCFDEEDGTLFFSEGGSTWPTRPYILSIAGRISASRHGLRVTSNPVRRPSRSGFPGTEAPAVRGARWPAVPLE